MQKKRKRLMYIQDQVSIGELDDEHLSFFRAIGVDSIHLELRGGAPVAGRRSGTGSANTSLAQDLKAGKDCTEVLVQAREKIEAHGMKLNNIFMPVLGGDHLGRGRHGREDRPLVQDAGECGPSWHSLRGLEFQTNGQFSHPCGYG